jgi:hypothetical protein
MRGISRYAVLVGVIMLAAPAVSSAQFRGLGQFRGTVNDDDGTPMKSVNIRATLQGTTGVIEQTTDDKGLWVVNGVAKGEWHVTFQIGGYTPVGAKVTLPSELARVAPISVVLKKVSKS